MVTEPNQVLLFTRYPRAGTTKTRLIPALGAKGAADLQRRLVEHLLARLRPTPVSGYQLTVVYADAREEEMRHWLGPGLGYQPQASGDLGLRMAAAMTQAFQAGGERVVLVGSDIPELQTVHLQQAFHLLQNQPVVFGPTMDGGYYLVGCRRTEAAGLVPLLFTGVPWSSPQVLAVTLKRLQQHGCRPPLLETLTDVDTPDDLEHLRRLGLL